jgi:hypothetical protein
MITLHPGQSGIFIDLFIERAHRYHTVNCSRGWGKSHLAATTACAAALELQQLPATVPNKNVYLIAPTFDQVVEIYFPMLMYQFGLTDWALDASKQMGTIKFPNNTEMRLLSYESVERMRGKGAYFVVWDEVSSCYKGITPQDAWESVIKPCIVTRWSPLMAAKYGAPSAGRALIISTPKGYNYFHDLCMSYEVDPDWAYSHFDYTQSPLLDVQEIEKIKANTDPIKFASEYLASFRESGANLFYMFDRKVHATEKLPYFTEGETVHAAIDFNVGKQHTSFCAIRGGEVHWLDEISGHPDTEQLAAAIAGKFKGHKILAFPDPSGKARKTSSPVGRTDFTILQAAGIEVLARKAAPSIADSVNCVNRMLENAAGQRRMFFDPKCRHLIASMERTVWLDNNPDTATIDKRGGWEHPSDGVRYFTEYMFPIQANVRATRSATF